MNRTLKAILLSAGLCSLPSLSFSASIVYDNLTTPDPGNHQYFPTNAPTLEFGDQITLTNNTDRMITRIDFYSFLSGSSSSTQSVTLRFYGNSGANPPVTPFYTTESVLLTNGFGNYGLNFSLPVGVPDTFTWTVQFSNLAAGQTGGLLLYGPPSVGSSFPDFWQKDAGGVWSRFTTPNGSDFAARFTAVPEPGVLALGGLGALLLAGLGRFRKAPG